MSALSPEQLAVLQPIVEDYWPAPAVRQSLGELALVTVSGPVGIGKTTSMRSSHLHRAIAFTTRPIREGEVDGQSYFYKADTPASYNDIIASAQAGRYVQVEVGPGNFVYGSTPEAYQTSAEESAAIMDNTVSGAVRMRRVGFGNIQNTYLVAPIDQWWQRFYYARAIHMDVELAHDRIAEARESTQMALDDSNFLFIENSSQPTPGLEAGQRLRSVSLGNYSRSEEQHARRIAHDFLKALKAEAYYL